MGVEGRLGWGVKKILGPGEVVGPLALESRPANGPGVKAAISMKFAIEGGE